MPLLSLSQIRDNGNGSSSSAGGLKSLQQIRMQNQQNSLMQDYPQMVADEQNIPGTDAYNNARGAAEADEQWQIGQGQKDLSPLLPDATSQQSSENAQYADAMKQAYQSNPDAFHYSNRSLYANDPSRQLPVIGPVLRGLDAFGNNPDVENAVDFARGFYVPGAGGANMAGLAGAAENGISRLFPGLVDSAAGRVAQQAATEAVVGAPIGAGQTLMNNPDADAKDIGIGVLEGGALGAGLGAGLPLAGAGLKAVGKGLQTAGLAAKDVLSGEPAGMRAAVNDFISKVDQSASPTSAGRLVQDAGGTVPKPGQTWADNFNRGEDYQKQYQQAVEDQYNYLKQSMENRGGVDQGGVIKDPVTGEVTDRYGRVSNNPEWYQQFFKENGRAPNDAELREIAEKQVKEGFQTEVGKAPSWKPSDIQEIDHQLADIQDALPHADTETRTALEQTAATLKQERERMAKSMPEGVQGMESGGSKEGLRSLGDIRNAETQGYAGNTIPFRHAATQSERTINRNQVVNNLRKNLGVTIDTGRLVSPKRGTLGQFKVQPEVIRSRMAEDLQVISHEVGHNLDKRYKLQDPAYQQELINLTNTVNPNHLSNYKPAQHFEESIAEYFRTRLTDPQKAEQLAPNFTKFVDSKLSPKDLKGLNASARDIDTWVTQGEYNQAKGLIDFTGGEKKEKFGWDKFYSRFVDDLDPLRLAEKALKGAVGLGSDSIYKMARLSRGISQRAEMAVKNGIYVGTQKVSDGLADIVKPIEKIGMSQKDFSTYLAVKHAQDLKAMGKNVPFDDLQMNAVIRKWGNNPVVQQAHQKILQYNNALLDILKDAQILSDQAIQEMRQKYPNYVPFFRYFDDDAIAGFKNGGFGAAKGFANITNPVKKMTEEGSTRTIINPIESMVKNTFLVMNAAAKNKVGLQLSDLSKIDGAGAWVEHVGKGGSSPHEHVVSVYENGVKQSYKVRNPELYNAMLSLDTESSNSLLKFLGGAASMLRAGATLTPDFMIRNMFRDVSDAMVSSVKYGFNPIDVFKGLFHVLGKTDVYKQFISSGAAMGTLQALDRDASREALQAVFQTGIKNKALHVISSPKEIAKMVTLYTPIKTIVGGLRHGAEISELSTRIGSFNRVLQKTGSAEEAAYQARDLMDFNRAGTAIRPANKAIAFLNANIQGMDRMRRSFLENPASFLVRAFTTLVLPSVGLYYLNHTLDPERQKLYDNIPQWQKDSFYIIPIPGTTNFARIPKPFEAGMMFATGTERVLRWLQGHDPEAFKNYGSTLAQTFTPPMMISALTPLLEATTNYSFFKNQPIVPQGEQRFEKKDQYGIYTSDTAKKIGQLLSQTPLSDSNFASPRIIDNTIKGYTAGLGQYAVAGIDKAIQTTGGGKQIPQPARSITERQPISSFMASTTGGGQIRQDFYDKWNQLSAAEASAKKNGEPYADPEYFTMKAGKDVIDKLMKQYKMIQSSPTISPDDKRAKLDSLDNFMNDIARQSLGKQ